VSVSASCTPSRRTTSPPAAVHLDPAPLIARYDAEHGGRPAPTPAAPLFEAERIRPERRGPNWTAAMVAAIVVVIGFVGFTAFKGGDGNDAKSQLAEGSGTPAAKKSTAPAPQKIKPAPSTPAPSDSAIAAAPQDKVTVQVSAPNGRSWISAKDHNGRMLFDGLLKKGESKTFQDSTKINLILGDAGAIQLYVNGKKIEDAFQQGAVQRLTYTKGDPEVG
jgi:cytoskeletal protein RodZ